MDQVLNMSLVGEQGRGQLFLVLGVEFNKWKSSN